MIGDGTILRRLGFPIAGAVIGTLTPPVIAAIREAKDEQDLGRRLEEAARQDPVVLNNLNLEGPMQSGTTLGMAGALLTSLGAIWAILQSGNIDAAVLGPLIATVLASLFGLWRRWGSGLKPLFTRRK